jgi:hypothetical protein
MCIDRGVDRFVAHALVSVVGMHGAQSGCNLLWRSAPIDQMIMDVLIQRGAGS